MSEQKAPETWTYRRALQPADGAYDYAIGANIGAGTESYQEACIAECFGRVSEDVFTPAEANARRIVACVNALAGIETAEIEAGVVADLIGKLERAHAYIDEAGLATTMDDSREECLEAIDALLARLGRQS